MKLDLSLDEIANSKVKMKILKHLLKHEASMSESELSKIVNVSHMTINRLMKDLCSLNLVSSERVGNANVWTVNKKSYTYKVLSKIIKVILTSPTPLEHLKKTISSNIPKKLIVKAILFGSIAQGKSKVNSDIDLFILTESKNNIDKLTPYIDKLSNLCLRLYGNRLSPYVLTKAELKKKKNLPLLKEIKEGIQIL